MQKTIGVLKLNTRFPRIAGDIGNPDSFHYKVIYQTVDSAIRTTARIFTTRFSKCST